MAARHVLFLALVVAVVCIEAAPKPFFDAIYDAVLGNGRRTYGYGYNNGYNGGYPSYNGYGGYNDYGYRRPEPEERHREGKSWKDLCRVHFPDSIAQPGKGGIVCPY